MILETTKGYFKVVKNVTNAFDIEKFEEAYVEEVYDKYLYILGDIAQDILRLKGFNNVSKDLEEINSYIHDNCAYRCPYFILKRDSEKTYNELQNLGKNKDDVSSDYEPLEVQEKEAFDKDSLDLESNAKDDPNVVLDMNKINAIEIFDLPVDLQKIVDNNSSQDYSKEKNQKKMRQSKKVENNKPKDKDSQQKTKKKNNNSNEASKDAKQNNQKVENKSKKPTKKQAKPTKNENKEQSSNKNANKKRPRRQNKQNNSNKQQKQE